jgi:hypothetical protein
VTTTDALPDPRGAALRLITQAASILEPFRDEEGEEDHRLCLIDSIVEAWDNPCAADTWESILPHKNKRWNAARELLQYDKAPGLRGRVYGRIVQVADQTGDLLSSTADEWPQERDHEIASQLREAIEDLAEVVRAITAVHLIEETAS